MNKMFTYNTMKLNMELFGGLPNDVLRNIYKKSVELRHQEKYTKGPNNIHKRLIYGRTAEDIVSGKIGIRKDDVIAGIRKAIDVAFKDAVCLGEKHRGNMYEEGEERTFDINGKQHKTLIIVDDYFITLKVFDDFSNWSHPNDTTGWYITKLIFSVYKDRVYQLEYIPAYYGKNFGVINHIPRIGFFRSAKSKGKWGIQHDGCFFNRYKPGCKKTIAKCSKEYLSEYSWRYSVIYQSIR